ncbi:MAG: two-component regulator propeller domain-containing protein [Polyangiaceae bacterium]
MSIDPSVKKLARLFAFFAVTLFACPAAALDSDKAVTQYVHAAFGSDSGLPQSSVSAIAQTRDGYMWLGTQDGLARFDGVRFKVFNNHEIDAFTDNFVSALFVDRDGVLWVGTDGGDLMRYDGTRFEALPPLAEHSVSIRSIAEAADGALWISSSGSGAHRLQGKAVTTLTKADGLPDDVVMVTLPRRAGGLWIGTASGLARYDEGRVTALFAEENLGSISSFAESSDGSLFAGTTGAVVEIRDDSIVRRIGQREGLPQARISALRVDRDGSLWIGTESAGVLRYAHGRVAPYARRHGLSDDTVLALFEDREGSLWIGTEGGGVNVLKEARFVTWSAREGLSSDDVSSILQARDGSLFFGTYRGGLNRLAAGTVTSFSAESGLPNEAVVGLAEDASGGVWVGNMRSPVSMYQDNRLHAVKVPEGLPNQGTRAVYRDSSGVVWIGESRGRLLRHEGENWSVVQVPNVGTAILALGGDRKGALWVGTYSEGLRRLDKDGKWTSLTSADGISNDMVLGFYEDADGGMWIPTHRGLNRIKDGRIKAITARDGLYHDAVYQTLEDDDHNFWMCSDRGISRTPRAELDAFADGRIARVSHRSFGLSDGMRSLECNNGSPSGVKGSDGRLYFATMGGVVIVDARVTKSVSAPPVLLEQVVADGKAVYAHKLELTPAGPERIRLAPGLKNIEFQYTAPTFVDPANVSARYRLEGFDHDWIDAGTRRTAYYTSLPAGSYRFAVMACNADRGCSESAAAIELVLLPHFYETRAFYGIGVAALFSVLAFAWTARTRQLKARAAELELLVTQRTGQLQQANERLESLAKVDELTALANRRCFNLTLDMEWRRARRLGSSLSVILIDVDDFKLFNDHYGHQMGDDCLREVAAALAQAVGRGTDLVARYGGEEFVILLPETPVAGCRVVAERARAAVQKLAIAHVRSRSGTGVVTLSAGMATVVPADENSPEDAVRRADEALYRAKQAGRNRVEAALTRRQ